MRAIFRIEQSLSSIVTRSRPSPEGSHPPVSMKGSIESPEVNWPGDGIVKSETIPSIVPSFEFLAFRRRADFVLR